MKKKFIHLNDFDDIQVPTRKEVGGNRVYVTPIGDVLVCPYVHIKIGNIFEKSLKEIVDYGFKIKYFRNHSNLCLAGEDKEFINKLDSEAKIGLALLKIVKSFI